jgi:two-component system response regulator YesN
LAHNETREENTAQYLEESGLTFDYSDMYVAIAELDGHKENENGRTAEDAALIRFSVCNILEEILEKHRCGYLFEEAEYRFGLILGTGGGKPGTELLQSILTEMCVCVKDYTGENILIGAGNAVESADRLYVSCRQAVKALDTKLCKQFKQVFFFHDLEAGPEKQHNSENVIDRVLQYIELNYSEELSLKKLSDLFYINQFYLGQLIKKITGINFNDYLKGIRINRAKILLQDESLSIKEISERVGYKYLDHFYKCFKEVTGINPGEFKKSFAGQR